MGIWHFLGGEGEASALIRGHDWSKSPLGPPDTWPLSLTTLLNVTLHSLEPAFIAWGVERVVFYNDAYMAICGHRHPAIGGRFNEVWADIGEQAIPLMDTAYGGTPLYIKDIAVHNMWKGRNDVTYFTFSYTPIFDDAGRVCGVFCHCQETTADVAARVRMEDERNRLKRLFEQAPGFMALLSGHEHRIEFCNAEYIKLYGGRDVIGRTVEAAIPEAKEQGYVDLLDQVYRGEPYRGYAAPIELVRPDGHVEKRYRDFIYQPVREDDGRITGIFVQGHDVTERVLAEERYLVLLQEMNHRAKNMFAVIAGLLAMSGRQTASVADLVRSMRERLHALSHAHELITTSFSDGQLDDRAHLSTLLHSLLKPFAVAANDKISERLRLRGPRAVLKGQAITGLTLIVHEHATNAVKYGALSTPSGALTVEWRQDDEALHLRWLETGGPTIAGPPSASGFGTSLTEAMMSMLGGSVAHEWHPSGLHMTLTIPNRWIGG